MGREHEMIELELVNGSKCALRIGSVDSIVQDGDGRWEVAARRNRWIVGPAGFDQLDRAGLIPEGVRPPPPDPNAVNTWRKRLAVLDDLPKGYKGDGWVWRRDCQRVESTRVPVYIHQYAEPTVEIHWVDGNLGGTSPLLTDRGWAVSGPLRAEIERVIVSIEQAAAEHRAAQREVLESRRAAAIEAAERALLGGE